jgi:CRISPR system Cascade subunit CasD
MAILLLRLVGPMQSWGTQSHFTIRDTEREPSKSGVIGLLCAALGRPRSASLDDLTMLKMGVRVDGEGTVKREFQIAQNVLTAKGSTKKSVTSFRYYLSDAAFLVGLQGDDSLLGKLQNALHKPHWALYLGRKSFVPALPSWLPDGLQQGKGLLEALKTYPPLIERYANPVRFVIEDAQGDQICQDVPLSFAKREFSTRRVRTFYIEIPPAAPGVF